MFSSKWLRLMFGASVVSGTIYAQCYDLTSVHLYEMRGRFQEHWDKPIWSAPPGEGNFHIDEPGHGGLDDFILFSIGQVEKTESGWVPLHKSRVPETWCEETPERSGVLCYTLPYQTPPAAAHRVKPLPYNRETWWLPRDGLLRYTHRTQGEGSFDHTYDFGSTFEALINLNTGAYTTAGRWHSKGHYKRRIPEGVELWRDTSLSAKVKLTSEPCTASVRNASFVSGGSKRDDHAYPLPICAVRIKQGESVTPFEFVINPKNASSPEGCIVAHEGPMPPPGFSLTKALEP